MERTKCPVKEALTAKLVSFEQWASEESKEHGGDLTALSAFRRDACALTGEKTLSGALGVLKAHKVSHEQHAALKTDLETKKTLSPLVSSVSVTTAADAGEPTGLTEGQLAAAAKMGLNVAQLTAGHKFHQAQLATMRGRA